ncbi:bifunctional methylenetetrahydrofolate dehydrogenase/methenyltetrahydrofolate cyclohydrolase [Candidatus Dojkabacteria bacterium]|nr:bifunctional methylenetetrahydrofolate dehydrogenase/methenyltetrahydrofolate cyclohydrolase [Candidatus Dojkabacteria bacterium]
MDGILHSQKILEDLKVRVGKLSIRPRLDIILVGDDFASQQYVNVKEKTAQSIGIRGVVHKFSRNATTEEIISKVNELNKYNDVTGFMIQLPLPGHVDRDKILDTIDWRKDVDGLTSNNLGLVFQRRSFLVPATALAVIRLLESYDMNVSGKSVVIVGAGLIAGVPLAGMFLEREATVTICHDKTKNIQEVTGQADILVSATGRAKLITADWIKKGAVVVDVGIEKDPETGKTVGDVDFDSVSQKTDMISPVPGGVGPMTIACLLENLVKIAENNETVT